MDTTLDDLPGEGETQTVTRKRLRRECEECGELAHYKHTFLFPNARSNPASKAYGRDDCSWCEDATKFVCREHLKSTHMDGYTWCSTFPASERFAHLFLYWEEI
jgi:hypothetical protein